MKTVGIRDLAERASGIVSDVEHTGRPVLITNRGRPVAVVSAIDEEAFYDYVLATAPEFVRERKAAEDEYAAGASSTRPLDEALADLDTEDPAASA